MNVARGDITVVLADSQPICLAGLRKLLEDDFRIVGTARDSGSLLSTALQCQPDVIVSDILLRFVSGADLIRQLKERSPASKIVILTNRRDTWSARESLEAGGSAYILKQDMPADLIAAIRAAGRGQSAISSPLLTDPDDPGENRKIGVLTPRQTQVLRLLAEGRTLKEIASLLDVSTRTVEFHKYELMRRLAVRNRTELMAVAARHGLIDTERPAADLVSENA